jgi:hypothetical protein
MKKTLMTAGILGLSTLSAASAQASALMKIDEATKTILVEARMVYSGEAATPKIAKATTDEIRNMWNEVPTQVQINQSLYNVKFKIDYVIDSSMKLSNGSSCAYNYIEILNKTDPSDRSYYAGLGSQYGVFYTSDDLGHSTTSAHEFGHGLMLDHNDSYQLDAPVPGIMFARGTLVKPEFQWNPKANPGEVGGTLNPKHRKVRSEDIQSIPFKNDSISCIGMGEVKRIK